MMGKIRPAIAPIIAQFYGRPAKLATLIAQNFTGLKENARLAPGVL
jgi:hypothetical protein